MRPFDLQINGYAGVDFCSSELSLEQMERTCHALEADGVDSVLVTVITDSIADMDLKLRNLVSIREASAVVRKVFSGIHIEGPFISPERGYVGAHPPESVVSASLDDAKRLVDASNGLTKVVTLAPERDPGFAVTRYLAEQGVIVSAGHCDPSTDDLQGAIDNGLCMVTHFGNGCPVALDRHDNVLQRFLSFRESLWFCFIPDGAHINFTALKNYLDFVGFDRSIVVTDAIAAAGQGSGQYEISGMRVEVDDEGIARKPGSLNLAGSTLTMPKLLKNLSECLGLSEASLERLVDTNPRTVLSGALPS